MTITRRTLLFTSAVGLAAAIVCGNALADPVPLKKKDTYKVGFAQVESNNPWRLAQTASMQDEAKKRGWQLVYTDAAGSAAKQVADVNSMIAQGVDLIFLAPREEKPLIPAIKAAKNAGIPVILLDRNVDASLAKAGEDYVTFIGSNFIEEGQRVADWLVKNANGKTTIIELEGTTGSSPANDRKKGFDDVIAKHSDFKIVASQTGDFTRDKGRQVAETLLQAHPDANVVYAHNDEMAIGAISAIEAAGKVPGKDILVLSIDGGKEAVQAVIDGKIAAVVECNPRFGPKAFDTAVAYANGEKLPDKIINPDQFYDASNAKDLLSTAY
ncbi:sugar ABC transporter substrate-binding protein [Phyllobacterium brassicacearum]|uniref:Sugar ABC transporter substrate-binding protein n=1 Tax=Phyllobacterium brassicacearum TaxID=314235 RepID=A0A2P7B789_9HYPH|nr:ABC transporter substrate-binding protein [Phyllobacterium brassicacearum]PSH62308.1 sugar ABC transporter substrate-binding protein [Phyllobacterium brassicacearum]TDQ16769.1 monosaccharide ABC transporter substrate-binding protein (CUT2 family) [Phyllobacterium brassicacearum]